ncbi:MULTISPECIES: ABC transporter ATP-binding protein [Bradyrhizobium]|jgi:branched-chain amino acid transport system ATP-binding protein|uniref:ABC transporter ATP-binding protein n=1 Tax=Bradyrhizobium TaxID=374 RepID=UPI00293F2059|nr:ABC transporter ATP-binding protein [Bradyrhizobium sp. NDS-1]WOH71354.1 ABC transporter ATP-binding protein [Bradyrhizobium sp. NDS-1]
MLDVRGICVAYGPLTAVRNLSLSVADGSIVSLIGSNGAGKTTTMKAIIGLKPVSGGEIYFDGERIDGVAAPQRVGRGIALSPEGRRVFPQMSVLDNLLVGGYSRRDKAQQKKTLDQIYGYFPRLVERRSQMAGSLSGGEQQMVAIGRALMARPRLLLLDEPSLGLAPIIVDEIARIIAEINRDIGVSIVLVEQNAKLALNLCHEAFVLETGAVALSGKGQDLLASDYVRRAYLGI